MTASRGGRPALRPGDLALLSGFHYLLAALAALLATVPALYAAAGLAVLHGAGVDPRHPPPRLAAGWTTLALGLAGVGLVLAYCILLVVAGRALRTHRRWRLVMLAAGLSLPLVPLGTVLGVLTIATLLRPEVQAAFGRPVAPRGPRA